MIGALILVGCLGCGSQQLEGSLSVIIDLHYTKAKAASTPDEMVVRFTRPLGDGEDIVLQVSASRAGLDPSVHQFDLAELTPQGNQRGTITRNVFNDPRTSFPPLAIGHLQLSAIPAALGQSVNGSFSATFAEGTSFASGRTVFGSFGATVQ
jgi:hypothetical protein